MHHTSLCFGLEGPRITTLSPPPGGHQSQAAVAPAAPNKQHQKAKEHWKNKKQTQGGRRPGSSGSQNEVSILKAQVQQLQQQVNTKQNYNQVPPPANLTKTESSAGSQEEQGGQPAPTTI